MSNAIGIRTSSSVSTISYERIFVPVDNSPHSNRAVKRALALGQEFDATLIGCHVYAARMHDYRFKQMEYTLPEEYLEEQELERQRKIHDSLITMGLELISDCYLEDMDSKCREAGLECERKMMDGKHSTELINDIESSDYDLVILGALGIGKVRDSQIGSVCERVTRHCTNDVWVVKDLSSNGDRDTILVGIDGSPKSFGALSVAVELARRFDKKIEVIGVYDPYLHYAVFKGIVEVLTDRASKVFRFEEQNQLHEEIIDTGLAQIYQSHLNVAESIVRERGVKVSTTLLDGKAFQKILDHIRKKEPWLTVLGRTGIHSAEIETLGSNAENLLRLAPCDVLLTTRSERPEIDLKAEEAIHWTPEAEERMLRIPEMVRGIARNAILRLAVESGHSVVTTSLMTEAMERFMPKDTAKTTTKLAEALALEKARKEPVSICKKCSVVAKISDPVKCSVCGAEDFEVVTREMIDEIISSEGGVEEEEAYDGRKVKWTQEARRALRAIPDKYQRRRCKARIEKKGRMQRVVTITLEFARSVISEETGEALLPAEDVKTETKLGGVPEHTSEGNVSEEIEPRVREEDRLDSPFTWTEEATARILRVPAGFMRAKTQDRIESLAREKEAGVIDLTLVEEGIEFGRQMMAEMLGGGSTPSSRAESGDTGEECPASEESAEPKFQDLEAEDAGLNETGWMSELARRRKDLLN